MRFVFIQNLKSTKEPKISCLSFADMGYAKEHVTRLLETSIDVESVDVYEFLVSGKKVVEIVWN